MQRVFALLCLMWAGIAPATAEPLTIFAAASLRGALDDVNARYSAATISTSYASSAALARQIQLGAPADIFISANPQWMDVLEGDIPQVDDSRRNVLGNQLVLIGDLQAPDTTLQDLPNHLSGTRIAIGLTQAVPAGLYAKSALQSAELWPQIAPHVVETDNVRAALALVALGEARYGFVYATDALAETQVKLLQTIDLALTGPIQYPAARLNDREAAQAYLDFLSSEPAQEIFKRHGFIVEGLE